MSHLRDMSHLGESLNDLLGPKFIAPYNSYKRRRREKQNHKPISFSCRQLPILTPKKKKHSVFKTILTEIKYLYPLKSRYLIIGKI